MSRLKRVEREWADYLFQPLNLDPEWNAGEVAAFVQGRADPWITWYFALSIPVRRRNMAALVDRLAIPAGMTAGALRDLEHPAAALEFLERLVALHTNHHAALIGAGFESVPATVDWTEWLGPGGLQS